MQILFEFLLELIIQTLAELLSIAVVQRWKNFPGKAMAVYARLRHYRHIARHYQPGISPDTLHSSPAIAMAQSAHDTAAGCRHIGNTGSLANPARQNRARLTIFGYAWILAFAFTAMRMLMR